MRAWGALALLAAEQRNEALTDQAVAALAGNLERRPGLGIILAYVEMNRENYPKAREFLEGVLARQPGNRQALDMVLRIDLSGRRMDKAETHAEQMLRLDPRHAFANYVMGTIMYNRGQYALAEQFIRVSLLRDEDPRALNDLAWLLQQRGADEEALRMIEKSLQIDNRNPSSWDTYGVILIKLGRLQDAEEAVSLALSQEPGNPGYVLHMAQILEKKNLPDKALELIQPLMNREADIPVETMEQIRALLDRVRS
jgi:tetratricopeptide (TPR) repeat protein